MHSLLCCNVNSVQIWGLILTSPPRSAPTGRRSQGSSVCSNAVSALHEVVNRTVTFCLPGNRNNFYLHGNETFYLTRCQRKRCDNFNSWVLHSKTLQRMWAKTLLNTKLHASGAWSRKRDPNITENQSEHPPVLAEILNYTGEGNLLHGFALDNSREVTKAIKTDRQTGWQQRQTWPDFHLNPQPKWTWTLL